MNRANPVDLRKASEMASTLLTAGIDFVPMPVRSNADKARLIDELTKRLYELEKQA